MLKEGYLITPLSTHLSFCWTIPLTKSSSEKLPMEMFLLQVLGNNIPGSHKLKIDGSNSNDYTQKGTDWTALQGPVGNYLIKCGKRKIFPDFSEIVTCTVDIPFALRVQLCTFITRIIFGCRQIVLYVEKYLGVLITVLVGTYL
jgi:hypothetical protein